MNFFSKLFGSKKEQNDLNPSQGANNKNEQKIGKPFFTNAPSHWGIITDEFLESNTNFTQRYDEVKNDTVINKRMFMVNSLVLLGNINRNIAEKVGKEILTSFSEGFVDSKLQYATTCSIHKLFDKGILLTNGIVIDNFEKYAVFLFTNPTPIAYISRLKEKFIENGFKDLIYYCVENPELLNETKEVGLPYIGLQKENIRLKDDQSRENRNYKEYALWWSDNPSNVFSDTVMYKILTEYNEKCCDINTYILGKLGYALGLNENDQRVNIPDYDELIIEGPEGVEIILTISDKTGINFHFPLNPIFEKYRDNFISTFVEFAIAIKTQVIEDNFDRDIKSIKPEWLLNIKDVENIESVSLILSDNMLKYSN
jgi:hypothetical protein